MIVRLVAGDRLVVTKTTQPTHLTLAAKRRAALAWDQAQRDRPNLIDGTIFSVAEVTEREIQGHFVPYRWFAAQHIDPELYDYLRVEPLAVTGRTLTADGAVLLARRSEDVTQKQGAWELAPAGGVEPSALAPNGTIDLDLALALELDEELGVHPSNVGRQVPRALLYDPIDKVHDVLFDVRLNIGNQAIREAFEQRTSAEYEDLTFLDFRSKPTVRVPDLGPDVWQLLKIPLGV